MYGPRRARRSYLALRQLETRDNPSGSVDASVTAGVLTLAGDDDNNIVQVLQTGPGAFTVTGVSTDIDGGTNFTGVNRIVANLRDGNDNLQLLPGVDLGSDGLLDFNLTGAVTVNLGDGDNTFDLSVPGTIRISALTIRAGDGQDQVTLSGGPATGGEVSGNVLVSLGLGRGPQPPADLDTHLDIRGLAVGGLGGLKYIAGDGNDQITLDDVLVDRGLSVTGGAGSLLLEATDSQFGSLLLAGTTSLTSFATTDLSASGVVVSGAVTLRTAGSATFVLNDVSTGPLAVQAGRYGFAYGEVIKALTVNGNLTFTGVRQTLSLASVPAEVPGPGNDADPTVLTVTGDINMNSTSAVDVFNYGSVINARNLTIASPDPNLYLDYDFDYEDSRLNLSGNLTLRGDDPYFSHRDGVVQINGNVLLAGTAFAGFDANFGSTGTQVRTTVNGSVTLIATTGEAMLEADGTALTIGRNLTMTGAGSTDLYYFTEELSEVGGTVTLNGGPEDDSFWVEGDFKSKTVTLNLKNGHNYVQLGAVSRPLSTIVGNLKVTAGPGTDSVTVVNARVTGRATIATGAGADELRFQTGATFDGLVNIDLGNGADTFTAGLPVPDPFDPGTPLVPAGPVTFNAKATMKFGVGNDSMALGVAGDPDGKVLFGAAGSLVADGGPNLNLFDDEAGQFDTAKVTTPNFVDPT